MAAVLCARTAVASHRSAAWLWGLVGRSPSRIEVTVPTPRSNRREFRIHVAQLGRPDLDRIDEIPVTSWARTMLDMAAISTDAQVRRRIKRSEELEVFDLRPLDDVLERTARHPGAGRLRRVLRAYRPDLATTHSKLERRFRVLVRRAGLPEPAMNYLVAGMELDAYWETERFVVELDVYATHGDPGSFESDRIRESDLLLQGLEMIRVTDVRLEQEPEAVIADLATHLRRRRRELGLPAQPTP